MRRELNRGRGPLSKEIWEAGLLLPLLAILGLAPRPMSTVEFPWAPLPTGTVADPHRSSFNQEIAVEIRKNSVKKLELNRKTLRCLTETETKRVEGAALTKTCPCTHTSSRPNNSCLIFC